MDRGHDSPPIEARRSRAWWLDCFAVFQIAVGVLFLGLGFYWLRDAYQQLHLASARLPFPPFALGTLHLILAWTIWQRRRQFWMPHVLVLLTPIIGVLFWIGAALQRSREVVSYPSVGFPGELAVVFTALMAIGAALFLWESIVLVLLLSRSRDLLATYTGRRPRLDITWLFVGGMLLACATGLDVHVRHQRMCRFAQIEQGIRENERAARETIDGFLQTLTLAARQQDQAAIAQARLTFRTIRQDRWLYQIAGPPTGEAAVLALMRDADPLVRQEAIRLFQAPTEECEYLNDRETAVLLGVVTDLQETEANRRDALAALLLAWDRKPACDTLIRLGPDAAFAVPVLAELIGDKKRSDWLPPGAWNAPVDLVNVLHNLGPLARDAVPSLVTALGHPNEWDYVPAVVAALGAIGPDASEAVPVLMELAQSGRDEVRQAALAALKRIDPGGTR